MLPFNVQKAVLNEEFITMYFTADIVASMSDQQRRQMGIMTISPDTSFAAERKQIAAYMKIK